MPKAIKSKCNNSKTKQSAPPPPSALSSRAATRATTCSTDPSHSSDESQSNSIALPQSNAGAPTTIPKPFGTPSAAVQALGKLLPISLLLSIVESSTVVPNAQPDPNIPPTLASLAVTVAMDLNSSGGYDFDASMASMSNLCHALPRFDQLLEMLKVTKGASKGEYRCWHCKVNRKNAMAKPSERPGGTLACGCDALKAVAEQALKEKLILGQPEFAELDPADAQVRRSLSVYDWNKYWWIMYNLIGFTPAWLLDDKVMKAGLQAAADRIVLVESE